jgi:LysM repeat protein
LEQAPERRSDYNSCEAITMENGKARLMPLDAQGQPDKQRAIFVDFNPQTLRLNYRTLGAEGSQNAKDRTDTQSTTTQRTGFNSGLTVELLFDTTRDGTSVRAKTIKIVNLVRPEGRDQSPTVAFQWGDLLFKGIIQSMDETLDYFSEDGVPLRATVSLSMSGNRPELTQPKASGAGSGLGAGAGFSAGVSAGISVGVSAGLAASAGVSIGTTPLTLAQSGDTLQSLAGRAGADWKAVASANNVDNPRSIAPGTVLNLNASASVSAR